MALHHAAHQPPTDTALRIAAAIAVVALAWAAAVYLHQPNNVAYLYKDIPSDSICVDEYLGQYAGSGPAVCVRDKKKWSDPAAMAIAIGGIAMGVGIVFFRRNSSSRETS